MAKKYKTRATLLLAAVFTIIDLQVVSAQELPIRGVVRPVHQAVISTDLFARILEIPFKEGQSFKLGERLVRFDCTALTARRKAAEAELHSNQLEHENQKVLASHNATGRHEVAIAKTKVDAAAAKVEELESNLSQCVMQAPFNGRIVKRYANPHEMPQPGNPLLELIDDSSFEIELIVPSDWLAWLRPDDVFTFEIEETGKVLDARVERFGAAVDPVSQTITVFGLLSSAPQDIKAGMSGSAHFRRPEG